MKIMPIRSVEEFHRNEALEEERQKEALRRLYQRERTSRKLTWGEALWAFAMMAFVAVIGYLAVILIIGMAEAIRELLGL